MSARSLEEVFAQSLAIPLESVTDQLTYNSVPQWDSVSHMALIAAIEEAFEVLIETEDVLDMSSFAKAKLIVGKYGVTV